MDPPKASVRAIEYEVASPLAESVGIASPFDELGSDAHDAMGSYDVVGLGMLGDVVFPSVPRRNMLSRDYSICVHVLCSTIFVELDGSSSLDYRLEDLAGFCVEVGSVAESGDSGCCNTV